MATIHFKGSPIQTSGELPAVGSKAPKFVLTKNDLSDLKLSDLKRKSVILNIFPSIDTGVCAMSVRKFNEAAAKLNKAVVVCVSKDLPFAQSRFCGAEGITNVTTGSDFRTGKFGKKYGLTILDGPLAGLLARAVIVTNARKEIVYTELVPETTQEPNYEAALKALDA